MECDLLAVVQKLENACPTNEINSYFFKQIVNPKNEQDKEKPIWEAEPDTVTQPEPAQDDQVLIVKHIKKEPQNWFLDPLLSLFKTTTKICSSN